MNQLPTVGRYPASARAALARAILLFASNLKKAVVGATRQSGALAIQCWSFGNLACFQRVTVRLTARHTWCNVKYHLTQTATRAVTVSIVRDATLDDQLVVLRLCLWFETFSGQLVLLLDGGTVPLGWSVSPSCFRVRHLLKHILSLDLLLEHTLDDFHQ